MRISLLSTSPFPVPRVKQSNVGISLVIRKEIEQDLQRMDSFRVFEDVIGVQRSIIYVILKIVELLDRGSQKMHLKTLISLIHLYPVLDKLFQHYIGVLEPSKLFSLLRVILRGFTHYASCTLPNHIISAHMQVFKGSAL